MRGRWLRKWWVSLTAPVALTLLATGSTVAAGLPVKPVSFDGLVFSVPSGWNVLPGASYGDCGALQPRVFVGSASNQTVCPRVDNPDVFVALAPSPPVAICNPLTRPPVRSSNGVQYREVICKTGGLQSGQSPFWVIIATFPGRRASFWAAHTGTPGSNAFLVAEKVLTSVRSEQ